MATKRGKKAELKFDGLSLVETVTIKGEDLNGNELSQNVTVRKANSQDEVLGVFGGSKEKFLKFINAVFVSRQTASTRLALKPVDVDDLITKQAAKMVATFAKMGIVKSSADCETIIRQNMQ